MSLTDQIKHLAEQEFAFFEKGKRKEWEPIWSTRVAMYWAGIGQTYNGRSKNEKGERIPWSAAFVSWVIIRALKDEKLEAEFPKAQAHAEYVHWAKANQSSPPNSKLYIAYDIDEIEPHIGDIIVNNRGGNVKFDNLPSHFNSHGAIVVDVDKNNLTVTTIGGNESDSVGRMVHKLTATGKLKNPTNKPGHYISVLRLNPNAAKGAPKPNPGPNVEKRAKGLDSSRRLTAKHFACFKENDFEFMLKYLFAGSINTEKNWTTKELADAQSSGLLRGAIMQRKGDAIEDFGKSIGTRHAKEAIAKAKELGIPSGATIYFPVDFDCTQAHINTKISAHFQAIHAEFAKNGDPYKVGCYGSSLLCKELQKAELVQNTWVNGSSGHGFGTRAAYLASNKWTILQTKLDYKECGVEVDSNECRDINSAGFF